MTAVAPTGKMTRWRPRKWEALHEQIVVLSTLGRSNVQIAEMFHYTPQHISNILNTPEAQIVKDRVLENLREAAKSSMDAKLADIAVQAVHRLKEVMFDDELFEKNPFMVVDRGIDVLKGVGKLKTAGDKGSTTNVHGNAVIMPVEDFNKMLEGAKQADEAKRLNAPPE